tara:strand:- start:3082 stop:3282 length:201 start_codon:yes stop_codon:yes gene_type:complete
MKLKDFLSEATFKKAEEKKKYLKCDDCGKQKKSVKRTVDPYGEELYGSKKKMNLCGKCYTARVEET